MEDEGREKGFGGERGVVREFEGWVWCGCGC
jgi:hypothetical protein